MMLDKRLNAYRDDLAAARLRGQVEALRFAEPEAYQVAVSLAPVRGQPRYDAAMLTEALLGETVEVYDVADGWAWGQLAADGYVGYLPARCLSRLITEPTHRVAVPASFIYPAASIKSQPVQPVHLNALVHVESVADGLARLSDRRYIYATHLAAVGEPAEDPAAVAELYVGVPYLWGGKSHVGLDCSGLVQLAFTAAGYPCPRDSDMMFAGFGEPIGKSRAPKLRRNDLVFWKGHVGIMLDDRLMVHANGHHMRVVVEPLGEAVSRIARQYGPVAGFRRP